MLSRPTVNSLTLRYSARFSASSMRAIWMKRWPFWKVAHTEIRHHYLHRMEPPQGASVTKPLLEISASTLESPRPWHISHSADGRTAFLAFSTHRDAMLLSFTPRRRLWSSAGRQSTHESFRRLVRSVSITKLPNY